MADKKFENDARPVTPPETTSHAPRRDVLPTVTPAEPVTTTDPPQRNLTREIIESMILSQLVNQGVEAEEAKRRAKDRAVEMTTPPKKAR